jgi:hypothetical protein
MRTGRRNFFGALLALPIASASAENRSTSKPRILSRGDAEALAQRHGGLWEDANGGWTQERSAGSQWLCLPVE